MGLAYSLDENSTASKSIRNIKTMDFKSAHEIVCAIKSFKYEIEEELKRMEGAYPQTEKMERKIAVLIRERQYLTLLESMSQYDLFKLFGFKKEEKMIGPEILQWYKT